MEKMPSPEQGQENDPATIYAEKKAKEAAQKVLDKEGAYSSNYWKAYWQTYYGSLFNGEEK